MSFKHLQQQRANIEQRWHLLQEIRSFFVNQGFVEVEAPTIMAHGGQEPYLSPMSLTIHNEHGVAHEGFLHTSPEYAMKKYLGAGFDNIFFLGKCFRDQESFGGLHQTEFTMLEWYRAGTDYQSIMNDTEVLIKTVFSSVQKKAPACERVSVAELFEKHLGVSLDDYLDTSAMISLCHEKKITCPEDETYENAFYRLWLPLVEPHLGKDEHGGSIITTVYDYPVQMAALAKKKEQNPRYAERFEVYYNGIELANAFSELTDPVEQRARFEQEQVQRKIMGKPVFAIDEDLIEALSHIDSAAGIALGVDRLIMAALDCQNIDDVLPFPQSQFKF